MCGIAGIYSTGRGGAAAWPQAAELALMARSLQHRGPDGQGWMIDGPMGLAHTRLSVIDPQGGHQPLSNEDGRVWVSFNGEIFNHHELRRQLQAQGHVFRTRCDTEVIVHLYEQVGDAFVQQLNGQFAIAIWDAREGRAPRLVLARDRVGIRPLFYAEHRGRLLFASEAKAILALPGVPRSLDPLALAETFTFWAPLPGRSVFAGIQQLPPGHVMVVQGEQRTLQRYWDWAFPAAAAGAADEAMEGAMDARLRGSEPSAQALADELHALLSDAVRLQLRSDVPLGAYLSGGLDSSAICALTQRQGEAGLRTFSVGFESAELDEGPHQRAVAEFLGTPHESLPVSPLQIGAAFARTVWHAEAPLLRTAPTPLMLLAGRVRERGIKVVLTGEGADEVLGGYDLFKEARVRRFMARQPGSAQRARLLQRLYPYLTHSPAGSAGFAQRFFSAGSVPGGAAEPHWFGHLPRWQSTSRLMQFLSPELAHRLRHWPGAEAIAPHLPVGMSRWGSLARDQYIEAHTLLSGYLLSSQGDRMTMAHGLEGRVPFLDHRVIEFANRLPPRYKLMGLTEKYLLKRALSGQLPESVRLRPKQPYRAPDIQSFFLQGRPLDFVAQAMSEARLKDAGYFEPTSVAKLLRKCASGRAVGFADNMAFVGVLSTMLLHELFVRQVSPPLRPAALAPSSSPSFTVPSAHHALAPCI
jgi:asparagine synthase (glutamine-hydrolysing)